MTIKSSCQLKYFTKYRYIFSYITLTRIKNSKLLIKIKKKEQSFSNISIFQSSHLQVINLTYFNKPIIIKILLHVEYYTMKWGNVNVFTSPLNWYNISSYYYTIIIKIHIIIFLNNQDTFRIKIPISISVN